MRIAIVTNNPAFFLSHRLGWAEYFKKLGHDVVVITPEAEGIQTIREHGFDFEPIQMNRKSIHFLTEFHSLLSHIDAVRNAKPDVVLNFTLKSILYGTIAGRLNKVERVVNTFTGFGTLFLAKSLKMSVLRKFVSLLFRVVFKSPRVLCNFQNHDDFQYGLKQGWVTSERSSVIVGSGIDVELYRAPQKIAKGEVKILFPSRLLFDKGIRELIEACEILQSRGLPFKLQIAGELDTGNATSVSKNDIEDWKLKPFTQFLGHVSNMVEIYRDSDIVCLPSYREGAPKSLIEACAAGKPIVTTDVPGCNEVVENLENGILVPVRAVEPLAEALAELIISPEKRRSFGEKGLERAKRDFDIENVMSLFCEFAGIYRIIKTRKESA